MPEKVPNLAVVVSRYNDAITAALRAGAADAYQAAGGDPARLAFIDAPGAWELTALCAAAARCGLYDGVVALGCVIAGQTRHDRYINEAVAEGLTSVTLETGVPVAFGLLTVESEEQARARAGGDHGNKGTDAMVALLATIDALDAIAKAAAAGARTPALVHRLAAPVRDKTGGAF
jgi:6,7-dimethyl-8-ribityllumazine synthase